MGDAIGPCSLHEPDNPRTDGLHTGRARTFPALHLRAPPGARRWIQPGQRAASYTQAGERYADGVPADYTVALYAGLRAIRSYNKRLAASYFLPIRRPQTDLQS